MGITNHFNMRCLQRGISPFEIELALWLGMQQRDKRVLGEQQCRALIAAIDTWQRKIRQVQKAATK